MSVGYAELTGMNPHAFTAASQDLSAAVAKLATESRQYQDSVVAPLKAKRHWSGGGQQDAAVVAEVNGLAIDTMRLRTAAGALAYIHGYTGFTLAQRQLTALVRRIEADDMKVDAAGNVSANHIPVGDTGGPGSTSAEVLKYHQDIRKVLRFATKVDDTVARRLDTSHEPPVTALTNRTGLLDQARQDHADATDDAQRAVRDLQTLAAEAAAMLPTEGELPDLPTVDVEVPPGAAANTMAMGLAVIGLYLTAYGAAGGIGGAMTGDAPVAAAGGVAAMLGVAIYGIGATQIRLNGGRLPHATITTSGRRQAITLDDLMQQAKAQRVQHQAQPGYRGQAPEGGKSNANPPAPTEATPNLAPKKAKSMLEYVETHNGSPPKGVTGGSQYRNDPENITDQVLPRRDQDGPITYREYDLGASKPRGTERLIIGSNGRVYYTSDHYETFIRIR